jgi:hypothetical protein
LPSAFTDVWLLSRLSRLTSRLSTRLLFFLRFFFLPPRRHILRSASAISVQLHPTLAPHVFLPPLPPPAARWTLLAARAPSSQPLSLSGVTCQLRHRHQRPRRSRAPQLFPVQLYHRRRLCTLFRRIGMRDQRQNNRPPLLATTCCFAAIGIATIAPFCPRPVTARQLHQLFSSRPPRFSSPFCFSYLSRAMRVGFLHGFHRSV